MSTEIKIRPEHSAQGSAFQDNPMVSESIAYLEEQRIPLRRVGDMGCGKLRHLDALNRASNTVILVDTEYQLTREQKIYASDTTIERYVEENFSDDRVIVKRFKKITDGSLNLDVAFSIAVVDVIPEKRRKEYLTVITKNIRVGGYLVVIAPRNDSTILERCSSNNAYSDGYAFKHHGIHTFYKNFGDHDPLVRKLNARGFALNSDLSIYRQVCLIFERTS